MVIKKNYLNITKEAEVFDILQEKKMLLFNDLA